MSFFNSTEYAYLEQTDLPTPEKYNLTEVFLSKTKSVLSLKQTATYCIF
jgi:hypothetical protein